MRVFYDWQYLVREYHFVKVKNPRMSKSAYARSRGIPESTFRKAIIRESHRFALSLLEIN